MERQIAEITTTLKHISKTLDEVKDKGAETHETVVRLEERGKVVNKRIDNLEETAEDYKRRKQRTIGILAIIAPVFGFIGAKFEYLAASFAKLWGH